MLERHKNLPEFNWKKLNLLFIFLVTVLCYFPAITGGYIWDDDSYVTKNTALLDLQGLKKIWLELEATPQYYPITFTTFWLEHQLWGNQPLGYHLVNVFFHILNALLIGCLLERLSVPGAWLTATLFALHPVHVESVAWITERKNVLSVFFYLLSLKAYFNFNAIGSVETQKSKNLSFKVQQYIISLLLFFCALGSKTVTCTLPATILLVIWWKRRQIVKKDVWPLFPFFIAAFTTALLTSWLEQTHVGAAGDEWKFTIVERLLIAGHILWFYIGKLLWPEPLIFTYPRWTIDTNELSQFFFPLSFLLLLIGLWKARLRIGRGPLTGVLFFAGTLVPALGFINVYPMRYSFVADHFQYLASIGILGLFASGITQGIKNISLFRLFAFFILITCGTLTWNQSHVYKNEETLWKDTIAKNPTSWMAHNNLAVIALKNGDKKKAQIYFKEAIQLKPNYEEARNNFGLLLQTEKKFDEALEQFNIILKSKPNDLDSLNNVGLAYLGAGNINQAKKYFLKAIDLNPSFFKAHNNLGLALSRKGDLDGAAHYYQTAIRLNPAMPEPYRNMGIIMAQKANWNEAKRYFKKALFINPNYLEAKMDLNNVVELQKKIEKKDLGG